MNDGTFRVIYNDERKNIKKIEFFGGFYKLPMDEQMEELKTLLEEAAYRDGGDTLICYTEKEE